MPLASDLARDHTVVVPDLRGMGLSARADSGFEKANEAKNVVGVTVGVRGLSPMTRIPGPEFAEHVDICFARTPTDALAAFFTRLRWLALRNEEAHAYSNPAYGSPYDAANFFVSRSFRGDR